MSTIKLTRAQRREMKRLAELVDKASQADRRYFERFPDREHRIRHAHTAEIEQEGLLRGSPIYKEPGCRIFTVVKNLCDGARLRILVNGPEDAEVDLSEDEVRDIFEEQATPQLRMIEADMRAITCREPAAS